MAKKTAKKGSEPKKPSSAPMKAGKKDPTIALILALVGALIFGFLPGVGHIYIDRMRKGLIYCVASLVIWGLTMGIYFVVSFATMGIGAVCLPIFIVPLLFNLAVVYDLYKITKGEKELLPNF